LRAPDIRLDTSSVATFVALFATFSLDQFLVQAFAPSLGDQYAATATVAKLVFFAWPVMLLDFLKYRGGQEQPVLLRAPMAVQAFAYAGFMIMFIILGRYEGASFIYFQF
jgi:hypothetical protein